MVLQWLIKILLGLIHRKDIISTEEILYQGKWSQEMPVLVNNVKTNELHYQAEKALLAIQKNLIL